MSPTGRIVDARVLFNNALDQQQYLFHKINKLKEYVVFVTYKNGATEALSFDGYSQEDANERALKYPNVVKVS